MTPATLAVCAGVCLLAATLDAASRWARAYLVLGLALALTAMGVLLWP